jgi:hypothetical protein
MLRDRDVTIGEIFGHHKQGDVGIEIEMEAEGVLPQIKTVFWDTVKEGSLRNGVEFVSKMPLSLDIKTKQISSLLKKVDESGAKPIKNSHRTSIHTHNNVTNYTPVNVWTGITAYFLIENILFSEYFGEERSGNLFCLRLKDADNIINDIVKDLGDYRPFSVFDAEVHKYAAQNLAPIRTKGSVELRGMKGLVDLNSIDIWTTASPLIFKKAIDKWKSPAVLLDDYYHNDWQYIVSCLFDDPIKKILLDCKNGAELMEENVIRVLGYSFMVPWNSYQKQVNLAFREKPKKKNPDVVFVDDIAQPGAIDWAVLDAHNMWPRPQAQPRPLRKRARAVNNPPVADNF